MREEMIGDAMEAKCTTSIVKKNDDSSFYCAFTMSEIVEYEESVDEEYYTRGRSVKYEDIAMYEFSSDGKWIFLYRKDERETAVMLPADEGILDVVQEYAGKKPRSLLAHFRETIQGGKCLLYCDGWLGVSRFFFYETYCIFYGFAGYDVIPYSGIFSISLDNEKMSKSSRLQIQATDFFSEVVSVTYFEGEDKSAVEVYQRILPSILRQNKAVYSGENGNVVQYLDGKRHSLEKEVVAVGYRGVKLIRFGEVGVEIDDFETVKTLSYDALREVTFYVTRFQKKVSHSLLLVSGEGEKTTLLAGNFPKAKKALLKIFSLLKKRTKGYTVAFRKEKG